ncbi:MAG: LON peptidase substrate-binding domain-containing protein [Parvibaculaceae bacterium]|nr:LON peptidase substrate-binding domain-containing protein [Parvibaculaceae bacterium]
MGTGDQYRTIADLPPAIPLFPLGGVLLLPRTQLPLNIFEPRYLDMVDDVLAGRRIIGMIQPADEEAALAGEDPALAPPLVSVGCAGRVTSFTETGDGRLFITLTGISRFRVARELSVATPYRQCEADWSPYVDDLVPGFGQDEVARARLLEILTEYLKVNNLQVDWRAIHASSNEALVNSLSMISPFGLKEKQALLEARTLEDRNQMLIAITEVALAQTSPSSSTVQ